MLRFQLYYRLCLLINCDIIYKAVCSNILVFISLEKVDEIRNTRDVREKPQSLNITTNNTKKKCKQITTDNANNKSPKGKTTKPLSPQWCDHITKTCLYNFDPLKPNFYIVKLGITGVYIYIFIISAQNHRLWVLVRTASSRLTSTHKLCFEQKYEKYQNFLSENFNIFGKSFSVFE